MSDSSEKKPSKGKNALEWTVFGFSSVLVIGTLIYLTVSAIQDNGQPADVRVKIGTIAARGDSTIVQVLLENRGSRTASEVDIAVTAMTPDGEKESTVKIDFVPRDGKREGAVVFPGLTTPTNIIPRIVGYVEP